MTTAQEAVKHLRTTGNITEATQIALGRKNVFQYERTKVADFCFEGAGEHVAQRQQWFVADQDKANRFQLYMTNQIPDAQVTVEPFTNGSTAGYLITITGNYPEGDVANVAGSLSATRMDQMAGQS